LEKIKMNNRQIIIEPNMEVFSKLGVKSIEIKNILLNTRIKRITFNCAVSSMNCIDDIDIIYKDILSKFGRELDIEFITDNKNLSLKDDEIKTIAIRAIERLKTKNTTSKSFLCFYKLHIKDNYIVIELNDENTKFMLEEVKISSKIENILDEYGVKDYKIIFSVGDFSKEISNVEEKIKMDIEKHQDTINAEREKIVKTSSTSETQVYKAKNDFKRGSKTKEIKGETISIKNFYDLYDGETCIVKGEVFSMEDMTLKSGKILRTIRITDGESSLTSKIFLDEDDKLDIREGMLLKLSGKLQLDTYAGNEKTLMINSINILEKENTKKEDTAEEKMVELHTHTKMSEMVGVTDVEDLIKRAKEYGHKAIAITDYSVVHSYPAAFKTAKKFSTDEEKMKAIFGCEMYMIDDEAPMVTNPKDKKIDEEEFVVFDIETTGLNSHTNEIIEIGAVKIKAGRIVDRYSQLINPGRPIPYHITEITSITDEQVANEPKIDEVIGKFVDFVGDAVLVAHNAPFDMGFIKRDIKKYLNIDLECSVIDTLQMARDLFPDLKKYGLGDLNKTLGLALEKHHRAVDDSQATANMFIIFLDKYKEKGLEYMKDINVGFEVNVKKQSLKNIMVLVKTQDGLKNMYKLVSESHIKYFGNKKARIPKSVLAENREGLIIGSSLTAHFMNTGELADLYLRHDLEKLEEATKFYDYIELLPKSTYNELIEKDGTGVLGSYEEVEKMNKYFYDLGKKLGILLPGDVGITPAFQLNAKYIIHVSGPFWQDGKYNEEDILKQCYYKALELAVKNNCHSIAFPLLSTGTYKFPKELGISIAIEVFTNFLKDHEIEILLVVFGKDAVSISGNMVKKLVEFIDDDYVASASDKDYDSVEYEVEEDLYEEGFLDRDYEKYISDKSKGRHKIEEPKYEYNTDIGVSNIFYLPRLKEPESLENALKKIYTDSFEKHLQQLINKKGLKGGEKT